MRIQALKGSGIPLSKMVTGAVLLTSILTLTPAVESRGFVHGIVINLDVEDHHLSGSPDGSDGAGGASGHRRVMAGPDRLVVKRCNAGAFGAPQWWSSDAPDGELLLVHAMIDTWGPEKDERYASRGYVQYHEPVEAIDGTPHTAKFVWMKHAARTFFTLDGGPHPESAHYVTPGVDYEFIPNGGTPCP